jgi:hypothetical protein
MGKGWDSDKGGRDQWIKWLREVMTQCLRVMKPGAHGLIWAIPRTSHWTATAVEDAGFEIRDVVTHLFGSGFPKSLDISKAIDKAAGAERKILGPRVDADGRCRAEEPHADKDNKFNGVTMIKSNTKQLTNFDTDPATDAAKEWDGWGTALKPASEHWILIRKPISEKTVAANVLKHGVGGINVDGSRVSIDPNDKNLRPNGSQSVGNKNSYGKGVGAVRWDNTMDVSKGRFPANLVLSHSSNCTDDACDLFDCAVSLLDEQSGNRPSAGRYKDETLTKDLGDSCSIFGVGNLRSTAYAGEQGGASRFFYVAKASKKDKGDGNSHPTVKSTKLMQYLIRMITPPGGTVLDPFLGSGTTGVAALKEGFKFIGIEREPEYIQIAEARINAIKLA